MPWLFTGSGTRRYAGDGFSLLAFLRAAVRA